MYNINSNGQHLDHFRRQWMFCRWIESVQLTETRPRRETRHRYHLRPEQRCSRENGVGGGMEEEVLLELSCVRRGGKKEDGL